jgi:hypothetical protein
MVTTAWLQTTILKYTVPLPITPAAVLSAQNVTVTWIEPVLGGTTLTGYEIWYNLTGAPVDTTTGVLAGTTPFGSASSTATYIHNHLADPTYIPGNTIYYGIRSQDSTGTFSEFVQTAITPETLASISILTAPGNYQYVVKCLGSLGSPWAGVPMYETATNCWGDALAGGTYTSAADGTATIISVSGHPYLSWMTATNNTSIISAQYVKNSGANATYSITVTHRTGHRWQGTTQQPPPCVTHAGDSGNQWEYKSYGNDTYVNSVTKNHLNANLRPLAAGWTGTPAVFWPAQDPWYFCYMNGNPVVGQNMPTLTEIQPRNVANYRDLAATPDSNWLLLMYPWFAPPPLWVVNVTSTYTAGAITLGHRNVVRA